MTFDNENMKNKIGTLAYQKPILNKYGTMKQLTKNLGGSPLSAISGGDPKGNPGQNNDFIRIDI